MSQGDPSLSRAGAPASCPMHHAGIGNGHSTSDAALAAARDHAVLAAALDPIITIDAFGNIQSASDSVQRVFGWAPAELLGRNVNVLMPEPHRSAHDGYLANYRRTGETNIMGRTREFEGVRKNGERFPLELSVSRVETPSGGLPMFVGLIRDISARKRLERELRLLKDIALALSAAPTVAEARVEALRLICEATQWEHGELWTPLQQDGSLTGVATWSRPGSNLEAFAGSISEHRFALGEGIPGRAWAARQPLWFGDLSALSGPQFRRCQAARAAGLRTAAAVPVITDGQVVKVVIFFARSPRPEDLHLLELVHAAVMPLGAMIQRKQIEESLRASEARVAAELRAMVGLHELVNRLLACKDVGSALQEVLEGAIRLTGAQRGNVQLLDSDRQVLTIAAQKGFQTEFLEYFREVTTRDDSACGRTLRARQRVIIPDVQAEPSYAPYREIAAAAGYRAVQSTPLMAADGRLLGLLSTHYAEVHTPDERDLRILDLYARQAADFMERRAAARELDQYRESLEERVEERTRALQESQERLRLTDRLASLGTLAAGLGHDMNNVLLPVRARLNALRAEGTDRKLSESARSHVDEIRKSVTYLQQLADGLHFLADDPDKNPDTLTELDLKTWWGQAGPLISKAVAKHVKVTASFPAGLPKVRVAPHGLTQAALNLVVNASDAIPERVRRQGRVRISAQRVGGRAGEALVRFSVSDNGRGMTEEVRRRACEMFFTTKPRGLGTGLGLALVHKVAERAGGSIEIQSEVGMGTTVTMVLSTADAASPENRPARPRATLSIADGRASAIVRHLLESAGFTADTEEGAERGEIWVLQPGSVPPAKARTWRERHPAGRLVLLGAPAASDGAAWRDLRPIIIDDTNDFETVRAAINQAVAALATSGAAHGQG